MKKSRFSSSQIVKILKEFEGGKPIHEVCRTHGISQGTMYNWRKRYGGMHKEMNMLEWLVLSLLVILILLVLVCEIELQHLIIPCQLNNPL